MAKGADGVLHYLFFIVSWHLEEAAQKSGSLPMSHLMGPQLPMLGGTCLPREQPALSLLGDAAGILVCSTWGSRFSLVLVAPKWTVPS